jgi:hypothetical protein
MTQRKATQTVFKVPSFLRGLGGISDTRVRGIPHREGQLGFLIVGTNVLVLVFKLLGYGLTRPSDAQVVTGFELVTRT